MQSALGKFARCRVFACHLHFAARLFLASAVVLAGSALCGLSSAAAAAEEPPLRQQIDQRIAARSPEPLRICSDPVFLRRVYLDLIGRIPTVAEARRFLADSAADKRERLVDDLLGRPEHARHLAITFDVMLMERRADKQVKTPQWRAYLWRAFRENRPWNELAAEIVAADGTDDQTRPALRFLADRDAEPNLMTRDIGRKFFGMDLQCCQCHDHPLVDAYRQADYYGIYAFVQRTFVFTDAKKKVFLAERAEGDTGFTSVFTGEQNQTRPRLPGESALAEPVILADRAYTVFPDKNVRPVPRYSRRQKLAELLRQGTNAMFRKNIVNRLWAIMMGRGLVEPLDMIHRDNPGADPELLELLAEQFARHGFDVRWFLRELALSKTYQRAFDIPPLPLQWQPAWETWVRRAEQSRAVVAEAEKQWAQALQSEAKAEEALQKAEARWAESLKAFNEANKKVAEAWKNLRAARAKLDPVETQLASRRQLLPLLQEAQAKAAEALAKVPDDALQKAVTALKARLDKLNAEIKQLEGQKTKLVGPVQQANAALTAAREAAEPAARRLEEAQRAIAQAQIPVAEARRQRMLAERRWTDAVRQADRHESLAEVFRAMLQVAELEARRDALTRQVAEADAQLAKAQQALVAARNNAGEVEGMRSRAESELTAAENALAGHREAIEELKRAAETVRIVGARLNGDAELLEIRKRLEGRIAALAAEDAELEKTVQQKRAALEKRVAQLTAARREVERQATLVRGLEQKRGELRRQSEQLQQDLTAARAQAERLRDEWPERLASGFAASSLVPLTPEQFAWSVLTATGQLELQFPAARKEADKQVPAAPDGTRTPEQQRRWEEAFERFVYDRLWGNEATFVRLFGHGPGQPQRDFFATVDQALFFENAPTVTAWLNPAGQNLTARLVKLDSPESVAEELFLAVLSRFPTPEEVGFVREYLQQRQSDKAAACRELGWALITSAEFRFRY